MATVVTLYKSKDGKVFETEAEANASDIAFENKAAIDAFVAKHFPVKEGSTKGNPHAGTAARAVSLWIAENTPAAA